MTKERIQRIKNLAYYMLEGNSYDDAAEEYNLNRDYVKNIINNEVKHLFPKEYTFLKNKPYMVFQRVMHKGGSVDEACKVFRISRKRFDEYVNTFLKVGNPKMYVTIKLKLYAEQSK